MAELMRLQKYMALCGVASRRSAEEMIVSGLVAVNGKTITELGTKVNPDKDRVTLRGKAISQQEKSVLDLVPKDVGRVFPVGRLDYDSEGLLLLTNDGDLTYRLTHPSHEVTKTYLAMVAGTPDEAAMQNLRSGVFIDGRKTMPAKAILKRTEADKSVLQITISEGRNRQVRKMCAAVGHEVLRLRRVAEGTLKLGDLKSGEWRFLTEQEIKSLKG